MDFIFINNVTMDKLAEEIFEEQFSDEVFGVSMRYKIRKAMQAYHEAKLKEELTDFYLWFFQKDKDSPYRVNFEKDVDEYLKQRKDDKG